MLLPVLWQGYQPSVLCKTRIVHISPFSPLHHTKPSVSTAFICTHCTSNITRPIYVPCIARSTELVQNRIHGQCCNPPGVPVLGKSAVTYDIYWLYAEVWGSLSNCLVPQSSCFLFPWQDFLGQAYVALGEVIGSQRGRLERPLT